MKKMLQAIRVLQLVSFFVVIQINFTPVSYVFLDKIFEFSNFKII